MHDQKACHVCTDYAQPTATQRFPDLAATLKGNFAETPSEPLVPSSEPN